MKTLKKRFIKTLNTVEAYACTAVGCTCNPAYCSVDWAAMVDSVANREALAWLEVVKMGV